MELRNLSAIIQDVYYLIEALKEDPEWHNMSAADGPWSNVRALVCEIPALKANLEAMAVGTLSLDMARAIRMAIPSIPTYNGTSDAPRQLREAVEAFERANGLRWPHYLEATYGTKKV